MEQRIKANSSGTGNIEGVRGVWHLKQDPVGASRSSGGLTPIG
jgi:hypothetical protein